MSNWLFSYENLSLSQFIVLHFFFGLFSYENFSLSQFIVFLLFRSLGMSSSKVQAQKKKRQFHWLIEKLLCDLRCLWSCNGSKHLSIIEFIFYIIIIVLHRVCYNITSILIGVCFYLTISSLIMLWHYLLILL